MMILKILLGVLTGTATSTIPSGCPNTLANESALDCPWAQISRDTSQLQSPADNLQILTVLETQAPGFVSQLVQDKSNPIVLDQWGISRNADVSHPDQFIVPPNLLSVFASTIGLTPYDATFKFGHAGLNHTYGYLFSNLQTPYGYKRARYVQGDIERGFGITPNMFGGIPNEGTLLSNFTYFISNIALETKPAFDLIKVPTELQAYPFKDLKISRLKETVKTDTAYLELRTDIVPFVNLPPEETRTTANTALLIYSIDERPIIDGIVQGASNPKLITAFPVNQKSADGVFKPTAMGEAVTIKLNYNAAIRTPIPATNPDGTWTGTGERIQIQ